MPAPQAKRLEAIPDPNKFNIRTHYWDARGRLKNVNHYRLHIENGTQYYERPVNSGNLFYENNTPAGRVEFTRDEETGAILKKKFDHKAAHKAYTAPLVGAELVIAENDSLKSENAAMKARLAELEAIQQEQEKKAAQAAQSQKPSALAAAQPAEAKAETKG